MICVVDQVSRQGDDIGSGDCDAGWMMLLETGSHGVEAR